MLEYVDRMQLAVRDRAEAARTFADVLGARAAGEDSVPHLAARRTTVQAGRSMFELLEPAGDGAVAAHLAAWGEGLFAAGFSTPDVAALGARLSARGVAFQEHAGQIFIEPSQTPGLRMVISQTRMHEPTGLVRYLYEATNLIDDHAAAAAFYADRFGLDASRFCPIKSHDYGYIGQLTMFNPPERLDRIELSQITDPQLPMGRFMTRRGGQTLYMCYMEAEEIAPIAERLEKAGRRYMRGGENAGAATNVFVHPTALHGVLMGISRTNWAWTWSGHPELAGEGISASQH